MPAVVPASLGFTAGLAAGLLLAWAPWGWALAPLCAAVAVLAWRRAPAVALALTGAAAGGLWGAGAAASRQRDCRLAWRDGERLTLAVEPRDVAFAEGRPRYTVRALIAPRGPQRARAEGAEGPSCSGAIGLAVPRNDTLAPGPLVVSGSWRREDASPRPWALPDRVGRLVVHQSRAAPLRPSLRSRLRVAAEARLTALFGPRRAALAAALTVSPEAALPRGERDRFARAGLAHLLSISGFHVGVLAGALVLLLRALRLGPDAARISGTFLVALYVWMLGFPAPALRSAALLGVWSLARLRQRPPSWSAALAVTALVVLALDPYAVFEAGPWLSFAGIYGCVVGERWWRRLAESARRPGGGLRWLRAPARAAAVSTGATLATAPITLLAFGTATPAALLTNLAAVPLAAFAVPALVLALVTSALPLPGAAAAAGVSAGAAGIALDLLAWVTQLGGALPLGRISVEARQFAAVVVGLAITLVVRPPPLPPARAGAGRLVARGLLAAGVVLAAVTWRPALAGLRSADGTGTLRIHFLAVGQGDAALVRTPLGRWILVDAGPRSPGFDAGLRVVVPFLRRQGIRRLALVVASHGDADHLGGVPAVLRAARADLLLEPGEPLPRPLYRELLGELARGGTRWRAARSGDRIEMDGITLRVLHPDSAFLARRLPANENSVVLLVEYGAFRAVFPGDAGLPMEVVRSRSVGRATVLKVGHHGSRTASGPAWLAALRPRTCVVSVGLNNRYGHPEPVVLAQLDAALCRTWRTDRDGMVVVETDGRRVRVRAHRRDTTYTLNGAAP